MLFLVWDQISALGLLIVLHRANSLTFLWNSFYTVDILLELDIWMIEIMIYKNKTTF